MRAANDVVQFNDTRIVEYIALMMQHKKNGR